MTGNISQQSSARFRLIVMSKLQVVWDRVDLTMQKCTVCFQNIIAVFLGWCALTMQFYKVQVDCGIRVAVSLDRHCLIGFIMVWATANKLAIHINFQEKHIFMNTES